MKISIFGLGYVGTVSAGCLASQGHRVVGVDPNPVKVELVNAGRSPIVEKDIDGMLERHVAQGMIRATGDVDAAIAASELSIICVATPSLANGSLDLSAVRRVSEQIGSALRHKQGWHAIVMRSSILPGSTAKVVIPTIEEFSGRKAGEGFGVCYHPEFLREGTAVADYFAPPKIVIGELEPRAGDQVAALYEGFTAPLVRTTLEVAEMCKYTDNTWHALKVAFANEVGLLSKAFGIDGHQVMDIFCRDTKLNLSSYYLRPGNAFGGSCLPKDLRALGHRARAMDLDLPVIASILESNERHLRAGIRLVTAVGKKKVGVLGFAFKAGTDDLREAPMVEIIEHLLGKGYELRIYDHNVNLAALTGANRDYIMHRVPHISALRVDSVQAVLDFAETVVIGNCAPEFRDVASRLRPGQHLVDLVRVAPPAEAGAAYHGICW